MFKMIRSVKLGIGLSLAGAIAVLGWLWLDARDSAHDAADRAQRYEDRLRAAQEEESRQKEALEATREALRDLEAERKEIEDDLTTTRKTLTEIREEARKETDSEESISCAIRPVPDSVDRLLRDGDED